MMTAPRDCPRYDNCSVPICPLDAQWHRRAVDPGEAVCPFLRETAKPDIRQRYAGRYEEFVLEAAFKLRAELEAHPHPRYKYFAQAIRESADRPDLIAQAEATAQKFAAARAKKGAHSVVQRDCHVETAAGGTTLPADTVALVESTENAGSHEVAR